MRAVSVRAIDPEPGPASAHVLKIDRSFVKKMMTEIHYMTLVNNIIQLAHGLDLKVVAEGVETKEEAQLLKLLRCEHAQGYLYSKPVNAEAFPFTQWH
ncbi:EAL domain-containing protein (plasmid) [Rhizobium sp. TH2]|uniref:EAL domain-containing protein n=1 Tax=Rhizobium sp. TH2 TaxID=2775403 RepID=UPI00220EA200|nr:EAL domain-containing protein [Rhizobium sp. TH2]UVC12226.1 EAL domain-containing protein [Rhizobium sp. TH2]